MDMSKHNHLSLSLGYTSVGAASHKIEYVEIAFPFSFLPRAIQHNSLHSKYDVLDIIMT